LVRNAYHILGVEFDVSLHPEILYIKGSISKCQQVLMNLIANAKDAIESTENKLISIVTTKSADKVVIKISDSGVGMADEIKTKIFEVYFTTKEVGKGTGIGLSFVRSVVEEANGRVEFESKINQGTTLYCLITGGILSKYSDQEKSWLESVTSGFIYKPFDGDKIYELVRNSKLPT
jgi:signal transduction histidine kinase